MYTVAVPILRCWLVAGLLGGAAYARQVAAPAQASPPQQRAPGVLTLRANARAVLLDVVVTDHKGQPVHGLKAEDFQLLEDGRPQIVVSLEEHHPPTAAQLALPPRAPTLPPNTFTNVTTPSALGSPQLPHDATTVFLLDALDTPLPAQAYVRDQLLGYFKTMQPGTEVAIFQLDTQLRLIQGFTSSPAILRDALQTRGKPLQTAIPMGPGYATQAIRIDVLNGAMQSLGSYLRGRPGRKNLIWFTAHIPRSAYDDGTAIGGALRDSESFLFDYSKATDALVLGQVSVYPIDSRGLETDPAFSAASRRGANAGGANAFSTRRFFEHTDLDAVAEATGGRAFYNTNGIGQVVSEVMDAGSNFYTLSFSPENKRWDGRYRVLKVVMEGGSATRAVQLAYRRGYFAVGDASSLARQTQVAPAAKGASDAGGRIQLTHSSHADEDAFVRVMQLGAVDPAEILFEAHIDESSTVSRPAKDLASSGAGSLSPKFRDRPFRVLTITYHVGGDQVQLTPKLGGLHEGGLEFVALIFDEKGDLVASSKSSVEMKLKPGTFIQVQASGVLLGVQIAVPEKGAYFLRAGVHERGSGRSGAIETSTGEIRLNAATP